MYLSEDSPRDEMPTSGRFGGRLALDATGADDRVGRLTQDGPTDGVQTVKAPGPQDHHHVRRNTLRCEQR